MNKVILTGRLTADPKPYEKVTIFTVAVKRDYKSQNGTYESDFINCKAFGKTAEIINKYFVKGKPITLTGSIRTGKYEKDGATHFTTDIVADSVEFALSDNTKATTVPPPVSPFTAQPAPVASQSAQPAPFDTRYL